METAFKLRCRRCRHVAVTDNQLVDTHRQTLNTSGTSCSNASTISVWYVSMDTDQFPWIQEAVTQASWTKGKLNCPKCNGRLGSFDYINSSQCPCGKNTLPEVHILRNRVDKVDMKVPSFIKVPHNRVQLNTSIPHSEQYGHPVFDSIDPTIHKTSKSFNASSTSPSVYKNQETDSGLSMQLMGGVQSWKHLPPQACNTLPREDLNRSNQNFEMNHSKTERNLAEIPYASDRSCQTTSQTCDSSDFAVTKESDRAACSAAPGRCRGRPDCDISSKGVRVTRRVRREQLRRERLRNKGDACGLIWDREMKEAVTGFHLLLDENEEKQPSSDDDRLEDIHDNHMCPVCLDVFLHPHTCRPCDHVFCESCLRQLAQKSDDSRRFYCPMCREQIQSCMLQNDLSAELKSLYPMSYKFRLISDRKYLSHRFPLPNSFGSRRKVLSIQREITLAMLHSRWSVRQLTTHINLVAAVVFLILVLFVSMAI